MKTIISLSAVLVGWALAMKFYAAPMLAQFLSQLHVG